LILSALLPQFEEHHCSARTRLEEKKIQESDLIFSVHYFLLFHPENGTITNDNGAATHQPASYLRRARR
jgi:hypothetical protein